MGMMVDHGVVYLLFIQEYDSLKELEEAFVATWRRHLTGDRSKRRWALPGLKCSGCALLSAIFDLCTPQNVSTRNKEIRGGPEKIKTSRSVGYG